MIVNTGYWNFTPLLWPIKKNPLRWLTPTVTSTRVAGQKVPLLLGSWILARGKRAQLFQRRTAFRDTKGEVLSLSDFCLNVTTSMLVMKIKTKNEELPISFQVTTDSQNQELGTIQKCCDMWRWFVVEQLGCLHMSQWNRHNVWGVPLPQGDTKGINAVVKRVVGETLSVSGQVPGYTSLKYGT